MAPRGYWHRFSHLQHQSGTSHGQSMEVMWSTAFSSATWSFHFILLHFLAIIPPFISALNSMSLIFKTSLESHTHIKDIKKKKKSLPNFRPTPHNGLLAADINLVTCSDAFSRYYQDTVIYTNVPKWKISIIIYLESIKHKEIFIWFWIKYLFAISITHPPKKEKERDQSISSSNGGP